MKQMIITAIMFLTVISVRSQQPLLSGKITYEKKFNVLKDMDEDHERYSEEGDDDSWYTEMRKKMPKYKTDIFQLSFNKNQSVYITVLEDENPVLRWHKVVSEYTQKTDFIKDSSFAVRTIYDKKYFVTDSLMKPVWKFSGEYREIAGYNCRKATTILYDSIYVIAFFTEAIPVKGGPDMYANLPGMILGIVLPRFHTTIFATKVETTPPLETDFDFKPAKKAMPLSREKYRLDLSSDTERWGKYGSRFVLKVLF